MEIPKLQIGSLSANIPIVQGGMGVRVSLASLASAVANQGGIGTISCIGLGDINAMKDEYERTSREAVLPRFRPHKECISQTLHYQFALIHVRFFV